MARLALRLAHLGSRSFGQWARGLLLVACAVAIAPAAEAQLVVGDPRPPSVSVDLTVLDRLGQAPTLPQLFGAAREEGAKAPRPESPRSVQPAKPQQRSAARPSANSKQAAAKHRTSKRARGKPRLRSVDAAARRSPNRASSDIHLIAPDATRTGATRAVQTTVQAQPAVATSPAPAAAMPAAPLAAPVATPPSTTDAPQIATPALSAPTPARDAAPVPLATAQATAGQIHPVTEAPPLPPAPAPIPAKSSVQTASAEPIVGVASPPSTITFPPGLTDLPPSSRSILDAVAAKLLATDSLRVQLVSRATGAPEQAMEARRVSLARAVAVRAYLIDKGVRSLRMDVRALGNRSDDGPVSDEVELLVVSQ